MEELKYAVQILKIEETGNISKAADELYLSQPALSRTLRMVESMLGFSIFDRKSQPLKPTAQGTLYVNYLKKVQEMEKDMQIQVNLLSEKPKEKIQAGVVPERGIYLYSHIFPELMAELPDIDFMLCSGFSTELERLFLGKKLDLCILNGPLQNDISNKIVLDREAILTVIGKKNPLLKTLGAPSCRDGEPTCREGEDSRSGRELYPVLEPERLQNQSFVILNEGQRMKQIAEDILKRYQVKNPKTVRVFNLGTALSLTASGDLITFVPESFFKKSSVQDDVIGFYTGEPHYSWELLLLYLDESRRGLGERIERMYRRR